MPPRSYYNEPRPSDYLAFAEAYFPDELDDARAFVEKTGLPFISSSKHIAAYLSISPSLIRQILHKKEYHYRQFELKKKDGTPRVISTPKTYLKVIQWWICDNILDHLDQPEAIHGFRRGRSYITNAQSHLGCRHILNMDIEQFFPSISAVMISECFQEMGFGADGANLIAELTSLGGSAPTGAPTSPSIGNIVLKNFDRDLCQLSSQHGLQYTRYADDLTFSSNEMISSDAVDMVKNVIEGYGFSVNSKKTKFMGPGDRMEVTGVVINDRPNLPREWRNWARGLLHRAYCNPGKFAHQWQQISGIYGSLKAFDPGENLKLTQKARQTLSLVRPNSK